MTRYLIGLILVLIMGCDQLPTRKRELTFFKNKLRNEIILSEEIKIINSSYIGKGSAISRPYNTWQNLISFNNDKCLVYLIPTGTNREDGVLKLIKMRKGNCDSFDDDVEVVKISNIRGLQVSLGFSGKKNGLLLNFIKKSKKEKIEVGLINYSKKKTFKRFSKPLRKSIITGVKILSADKKNKTVALGKRSDNYKEQTAIKCREVNKKCQTTISSTCDQCAFGWYSVVDFNCPQGGSRYCGISRCGRRGEPACLKGLKRGMIDGVSLCFENSPFGYCERGLRTYCDGNQVLICL